MPPVTPNEEQWWTDRVTTPPAIRNRPAVTNILYQSQSGSGAFLARLDDGGTAWTKALGNPQGDQALVTEFVCTEVGRLLGASVVDSMIVQLPPEFDGHSLEDAQGHTMRAGPAYASRHLGFTLETDSIAHGGGPDSVIAGLSAMWDLLLGDDEQWLYTPFDEQMRGLISFDHSLWLARGPGDWDSAMLRRVADQPWPLDTSDAPLAAEAVATIVTQLRALRSEDILSLVSAVPVDWKVSTTDLATLGWFIWRRRESVARRVEKRGAG